MKDWRAWHTHYDEPNSDLAQRLKIVQEQISNALPRKLHTKFQIIDMCAGDGRDIIPVLAQYPHALLVNSLLVEIDTSLSDASKKLAARAGVSNITFETSDASLCSVYRQAVPADLILLCGVFGNISEADVENTINNVSMLCKKGTRIIWTRNRREPDATPRIRKLFVDNGFKELAFVTPQSSTYAIGVNELAGTPKQFDDTIKLFTFIK